LFAVAIALDFREIALLSITTELGNHPLAVALLSSLSAAVWAVALLSAGSAAKPKVISQMGIDDCASQFYCYSADDLCLLDCQLILLPPGARAGTGAGI
jgi:hypothetical protein